VRSIRSFLIGGTVAILILFNFIAALRGYQGSMREADLLFDNQLLDLSQLVAHLDTPRISRDFRLGNNVAFQIWDQGQLLAASYHAPRVPINGFAAGFDFANFDGYRWRTFTWLDELTGRWIIVAERTDLRFVLAENVVLESIAPILFGIPVAGLVIWFIVSFGLKPLQVLSADLRGKRAHDLTPLPQRQTPRELDQVVQSVNGFVHRLNEALEREKRFSADAAHELRTPISALKIQLHNLAQEVDTHSDAFIQLQQGVERMQHLVEQLLSLYRNSPEQFAARCRPLDLHVVVEDVLAQLYPLIEQKQQTLELEGDSSFINGDRFALETLVLNLVSNASRYTPKGGRIQIRLEHSDSRVCLVVEDNGPGIAEAERERIFDRFYRTNPVDEAQTSSSGLGLAIVRHVADLHQAQLSVEASSFATGVAFKVSFPEYTNAP
jgi:two-component system sensor histidine kinase QseC